MSETPQTPTALQAPAEFHWGISYLRADFQHLRSEFHHLRTEVRADIQDLRAEIQGLRTEVRADVQDLRAEIRGIHVRIDDGNKRQDTHFRWLMTTMIALAGVIIAVLKT